MEPRPAVCRPQPEKIQRPKRRNHGFCIALSKTAETGCWLHTRCRRHNSDSVRFLERGQSGAQRQVEPTIFVAGLQFVFVVHAH